MLRVTQRSRSKTETDTLASELDSQDLVDKRERELGGGEGIPPLLTLVTYGLLSMKRIRKG